MMTAKEKDLWKPYGEVSDEDVRHMQSRVRIFKCVGRLPSLKDTEPCVECMCRWLRDGAAAYDARGTADASAALPSGEPARSSTDATASVVGLADLVTRANLPQSAMEALRAELVSAGAVHVRELEVSDWQSLRAFVSLRVFEQRRLLANL